MILKISRTGSNVGSFRHKPMQIQTPGVHPNVPFRVSRPLIFGAVPVKLNPILVGVTQIQRLADPMVGGAIQGNLSRQHAMKRVRECRACRIQDSRMIQSGCPRRGRGAANTLSRI